MAYMDGIMVRRGHLEEIQGALDAALGYHGALDLMDAARSVGASSRESRLTALLGQQLERVGGYLMEEPDGQSVPEA